MESKADRTAVSDIAQLKVSAALHSAASSAMFKTARQVGLLFSLYHEMKLWDLMATYMFHQTKLRKVHNLSVELIV